MHGPTLSIIWVLSLAIFVLRQVRFWVKKRPLAISVAAWLLYVALVYLRTVPWALAALAASSEGPTPSPPGSLRRSAYAPTCSLLTLASSLMAAR